MAGYFFKKLLYGLLIYYSVATIVFFIFSFSFPSPDELATGQRSDEKTKEAIKKEFGLDKPIKTQYLYYINDVSFVSVYKDLKEINVSKIQLISLGGNKIVLKIPYLRRSFQTGKQVNTIIKEAFTGTLILAVSSILLATIAGVFLGCLAAVKKDTWVDRLILFISTTGISLPSFFVAIILAWLLGFVLSKYTGLNMTGNYNDLDPFRGEIFVLKNLILPTLALGIRPLSIFSQLTRASVLDVLPRDYIRTAKAKGLSKTKIVTKHVLRNSLIPVVTSISGWFASLLTGTFFVEFIFNWKGLGKITVDALDNSDLPLVMGAVIVVALIFVFVNIAVDILYSILDPRVTLE
ncbi:MAG: ABC transporter permease [Bacteroidetes bacterium]|nr:ABC transporter permease [Bacteroidota bacterium]